MEVKWRIAAAAELFSMCLLSQASYRHDTRQFHHEGRHRSHAHAAVTHPASNRYMLAQGHAAGTASLPYRRRPRRRLPRARRSRRRPRRRAFGTGQRIPGSRVQVSARPAVPRLPRQSRGGKLMTYPPTALCSVVIKPLRPIGPGSGSWRPLLERKCRGCGCIRRPTTCSGGTAATSRRR